MDVMEGSRMGHAVASSEMTAAGLPTIDASMQSGIPQPKARDGCDSATGWARQDLNLHGLRHGILSPACLPFHHSPIPECSD